MLMPQDRLEHPLSNSDLLLVDVDPSFQVPFPFACARFDREFYVVVDTHARDIVAVSNEIFAELCIGQSRRQALSPVDTYISILPSHAIGGEWSDEGKGDESTEYR